MADKQAVRAFFYCLSNIYVIAKLDKSRINR